MKEITFICPPHCGHYSASTSQIFLRSVAHSCLQLREHAVRSCMQDADLSMAASVDKMPCLRSLPLHTWLYAP